MGGTYNQDKELEYQLQIGSKLFPEYPCRPVSQAFYELKKGSWYCELNISQYLNSKISIAR